MGPPLAGPPFLNIWGALPVSDLFDKIDNTMPADMPGTLTRPQVADLVAFVLEANQFPAGTMELSSVDAALKQISLAGGRAPAAPAGTGASMSFPATGTLNQVMTPGPGARTASRCPSIARTGSSTCRGSSRRAAPPTRRRRAATSRL